MTSSGSSSKWKVDRIWRHAHDAWTQQTDPRGLCRYMVAVSNGDDVRVHTVYATDELEAFKKYKERY